MPWSPHSRARIGFASALRVLREYGEAGGRDTISR